MGMRESHLQFESNAFEHFTIVGAQVRVLPDFLVQVVDQPSNHILLHINLQQNFQHVNFLRKGPINARWGAVIVNAPSSIMNSNLDNISFGLTSEAAAERLRADGPNELPAARPKSNFRIAVEVL